MATKTFQNLFNILCPTRNFGVKSLATRQQWSRYPEPCYWEITRIAPKSDLKHGKVYGILTWRGQTESKARRIPGSLKRDWNLFTRE